MDRLSWLFKPLFVLMLCCGISTFVRAEAVEESKTASATVVDVKKLNPTTVEVILSDNQRITFDFYGDNIFRVFQDVKGGILRDPQAEPEAQILVDNPRRKVSELSVKNEGSQVAFQTSRVKVEVDKKNVTVTVTDLSTNQVVIEQLSPVLFEKKRVSLTLKENKGEYFYGGGVQNGRFSHKGKAIAIENQNSWTDGGVASPTPFYWSTNGYGVMWYTFKRGTYDFGAANKGEVLLSHETDYLDLFFMVDNTTVGLLNDFYQLTGNPVLLPKFGLYEGHLNAYNRDYWKEVEEGGVKFEDGKRYKESQKDNGGIKESLNGEKGNYQFSARAVIDRYEHHDMPLGWILPNDGYGAGYGQTETLDGNIQNLKELGDYAREKGVEIGLWTQSDLHPKDGISALLQRDIIKEVRDAGVRVLKTDVAWVGAGYSFGLNGVADVGEVMPYYGSDARPFIISLDGWAGTQRYATVWSGDQTGGKWEYIRFHIPTYIGSGLSGQPNICSDMDGIFGGKNSAVNIRDFQWKAFSLMQLNMDGWGANEKYPHALGEPATSINRMYLKLKSELIPYTYSVAEEAVDGLPIMRAMFLEYPNEYTKGKATQYQYLYGSNFLVAPIYQETAVDKKGNDVRNGIYLPEGIWIDYFSGEEYEGNRIINSFNTPIWKLPVFVKKGAIIPMANATNNVYEINKSLRIYEVYPYGSTSFTEYDDDGTTEAYRLGEGATTLIESNADNAGEVTLTVHPTQGSFEGMVTEKVTEFKVNVTAEPKKIAAIIGGKKIKLTQASSEADYDNGTNVFYYDAAPELNKFATEGSEFASVKITKNPQLLVKLASTDITSNAISVVIKGYEFAPENSKVTKSGDLSVPSNASVTEENTEAYTLVPSWNKVENADYYEIEFNGMLYSTIRTNQLLFEDLMPETTYSFKLRAVNKTNVSDWTTIEATTKSNPLEFAITGLSGECSAKSQSSVSRMFDFAETRIWHSKYYAKAVPFDLTVNLGTINKLDKFHYIPRDNAGNGTIIKGEVYYSMDKQNWHNAGKFSWERNAETKVFTFDGNPTARYIKLSVSEAVGDYGSGRELYVFKVPGTESYIPGDINKDHLLDINDFTSYLNYTGLRKGDADFDYVSIGDVNQNGGIDAYDISVVATQLGDDEELPSEDPVAGEISMSADKKKYTKGETVTIKVSGKGLVALNAISLALPYNEEDLSFESIEALETKTMENLTNDRLHTDGEKVLYPTFVNKGNKPSINGDKDLFIVKFKAKRAVTLNLKMNNGVLVDKKLNSVKF
ncbi:DUF5110 domain-containing protein [Puteibacter caeruleilacunae]|nr:DUF5110 domain-containing protein [Puteibacter caeruleilacunae]